MFYFCAGGTPGFVTGAGWLFVGRAFPPGVETEVDFGMKNAEVRHNIAITNASTQVPFSSTSVVCFNTHKLGIESGNVSG
jgi:hypothetical protein